MNLSPFILSLDGILILTSIWMAILASRLSLGGALGKTVGLVVWGAIVLGLAHATETTFDLVFDMPTPLNEFTHRLIILVGFVLLSAGLRSLALSIRSAKSKPR
ncbi:MAG: hypothetical protein ABIQ90_10025 [Polaromonas sp.]